MLDLIAGWACPLIIGMSLVLLLDKIWDCYRARRNREAIPGRPRVTVTNRGVLQTTPADILTSRAGREQVEATARLMRQQKEASERNASREVYRRGAR